MDLKYKYFVNIMGNLCCYFCRTKRCVYCGVPHEYYSTDEQRSRPSCRGYGCNKPSFHGDYFNDYPGLSTTVKYNNNGYHKFN